MRNLSIACLFLFLLASPAEAGSISFSSNPTSPASGGVSASGTYTLDTGETLVSITLYASPSAGGDGIQASCTPGTGNSWNGGGGGLPAGTYSVTVMIEVTIGGATKYYVTDARDVVVS